MEKALEATTTEIVRSLWIIYQQMPTAVQDEFKRLVEREEDANGLVEATEKD